MSKEIVIFQAQRKAFESLSMPTTKDGSQNPFYVNPASITIPATLIQEQKLVSGTSNYVFNFGTKAPTGDDILNNVILGDNNVAQIYAIQILLGQGPTKNIRQYRSFGPSVQDNVLYNGQMSMKMEQNTLIDKMDMFPFRKENGTFQDQFDGIVVINPQRILTGRVSTFNVLIDLPKVSTLIFTPDLFISVRLQIALGQAAAVK